MKKLIIAVVSAFLLVFLLGAYLSPDDLDRCNLTPTDGECRKADLIVAVSGGDTTARTQEAVALYERGWADKLLFSGAAADKYGPSNAAAMRSHALDMGVPNEAIMVEESSETTKQNAALSSDVVASNHYSRVIVVTSSYHQRRAGLEFRNIAGPNVQILNHPVAIDNQWRRFWWITPTGWWLAISEFVKIIMVYAGASR